MTSRGYAAHSAKAPLTSYEFLRRTMGDYDVSLDISYAGICHSDIHTVRDEWGPALYPCVPGHEIAGVVTSVGSAVTRFSIGDRIGVGVYIDTCRECESCTTGFSQYCDKGIIGTYNAKEKNSEQIAFGGYSNNFVIDEKYAVHIPSNLDMAGVAPLMCAGITLYSPLRHWKAGPGKKVGVIGLGGLGHMGVKFAKAMGAHVTVFSHSPNKKNDAIALGADEFILTTEQDFNNGLTNTFDLVLNTVAAEIDVDPYLRLLKRDATLVFIGLSGKPYPVNAGTLLGKRRSISGSMIGSYEELQEMLDFCGKHNIVSDVEVIDPSYINQAYERTVASDVKYRFVIDASKF
jgi:uncharacterized zinc-type alcohol dehydrogenase-like protein